MNRLQRAGLLMIAVLAVLGIGTPAFAAPATRTVEIVTVPPTPAARFTLDGVPLATDDRGIVRTTVPRSAQGHRIELATPTIETPDATREFVRWSGHSDSDQGYTPVLDGLHVDHTLRLRVAFRESRTVGFTFVDQAHHKVDPGRIQSITLRDDAGRSQTFSPTEVVHLTATRPTLGESQIVARDSTYSVQSVKIDGADVVNVGEQRFRPIQTEGGQVEVVVLLRSVHFRVQDRLLGTSISTVVHLAYPNGMSKARPTDANGELVLENLARGTYTVAAEGQVFAMDQELALSRSQFVTIYVLSRTDALIIGAVLLMIALGLLALGRWRYRQLPVVPAAVAMSAIAAGEVSPVAHSGDVDGQTTPNGTEPDGADQSIGLANAAHKEEPAEVHAHLDDEVGPDVVDVEAVEAVEAVGEVDGVDGQIGVETPGIADRLIHQQVVTATEPADTDHGNDGSETGENGDRAEIVGVSAAPSRTGTTPSEPS